MVTDFCEINASYLFNIHHISHFYWFSKENKNIVDVRCFCSFSILYNIGPYLNNKYSFIYFSLSSDADLINIQMFVVAISNFAFGMVYFVFYRNVRSKISIGQTANGKYTGKKAYLMFSLIVFSLTLYFVFSYGWNDLSLGYLTEDNSIYFSIAAYFKNLFVSCYLYYIYKYGMDNGAIFLIFLHTIIMGIDGARTTYFPLLIFNIHCFKFRAD